jgi:hypothetical protein
VDRKVLDLRPNERLHTKIQHPHVFKIRIYIALYVNQAVKITDLNVALRLFVESRPFEEGRIILQLYSGVILIHRMIEMTFAVAADLGSM